MSYHATFAEALRSARKQIVDVDNLRNSIEGFRRISPNLPICEATHIGVLPNTGGLVILKSAATLDSSTGFYQQFDSKKYRWEQLTRPTESFATIYSLDKNTASGKPAVSGEPSAIWPPRGDSGVPAKSTAVSRFNEAVTRVDHPYHSLAQALLGAFEQASAGKGKERHADDLPFTEQKIQKLPQTQGHVGGLIYQIAKKALESENMDLDARVRELQGVIVYAAGAIVFTDSGHER